MQHHTDTPLPPSAPAGHACAHADSHGPAADADPTSGSGLEVKHHHDNSASHAGLALGAASLHQSAQSSESSPSASTSHPHPQHPYWPQRPHRHPYAEHSILPPSEQFRHHVLDVKALSLGRSHTRSQSHHDLPLDTLSSEPSLPPSLTTTPDSPIARPVPLPSVEDIFTSRPCSPWRTGDELREPEPPYLPSSSTSPQSSDVGHDALHDEPVYRNRLLDMVRDEFDDLKLGGPPDDSASMHSMHGLELDGMSSRVSRSNTIRSRASTSRGISPQPTIVLSLEHEEVEETLHEGHEGCTSCHTDADGAERSFRPASLSNGLVSEADGVSGSSENSELEGAEGAEEPSLPRKDLPEVLSLAELRSLALPASWPRVAHVSPEKVYIDRRVSGTALPIESESEDFGGLVPLDIPAFELGDAAIDPALSSSIGSSVGSSVSSVSRLSRDRKGSNETAITAVSSASSGHASVQLFGRDFAARLICSLYRANLLKSPISSPLNSPSTSPSTGTATAWWGGGLSVRSAAREVLRGDWDEPSGLEAQNVELPATDAPTHGLALAHDADAQEVELPEHSDSGSNCSTPIAASGSHHRPTVTLSGFKLEGKQFEFDPAFSPIEVEALHRELGELIAHAPPPQLFHYSNGTYGFTSPGSSGFSGSFTSGGLAAEIGPLAPELATTRPSTPPDTPTLGSQPLPMMTAPVTPMHTRPSSPNVFQKAVAINAALQQLARGDGPRCGTPLSPLSVSTTNEKPSRLEEMRRQSLKAAGVISPASSGVSSPNGVSARRKSLEWAKMAPRSSGEYARDIFGLSRESTAVSVSQPSSPEFLKRKLGAGGGPEWDLSTTESAPGSPKSSRRNTLSGLGLFLTRAGRGKK